MTTDQGPKSDSHPLDTIFYPKSVAVLGVTPTPDTVPNDIFRNILTSGYTGVLYPVAPFKRSIYAVKAYRYVLDIPDEIDQAVIVYPGNVCHKAVQQCGEKGVKSIIMISAGFREVGPEGVKREAAVKEICDQYDMKLIGPNCLGVINTDPTSMLNASFARKMPAAGRIAFLSQSGALCTAVLDYALGKGIGFSKFVSFGNKAGVTDIDLMRYLHKDPKTDVILIYLEELRDGRGLVEAAREITRGPGAKPILLIKSGRTPQGADAAASHTGSLAGEDVIADAVLKEAGIIRVDTIDELFNSAIMMTYQPPPRGRRLAIVTNAGGPGVMATDAAVNMGLEIPRFGEETTNRLKTALPAAANIKNPVDVIGDARADRYSAAIEAVLDDDNVDQALVILTPQSMTDIEAIAECVVTGHERTDKPLACSFMGGRDVQAGIDILQAARIPHYILPEWACGALLDSNTFNEWKDSPEPSLEQLDVNAGTARAIINSAPAGYMSEDQCLGVLGAYGFPVPPYRLCTSGDQAASFAKELNCPAVLRIVSPDIVHKFEVKGVALDLNGPQAVRQAWDEMMGHVARIMPKARIIGAIVRPMIPSGKEVILGAKRDNVFGPIIMFGLGGLFVEVFKDVTFALAPVTAPRAASMVRGVKAYELLTGARGTEAADVQGIEECIRRLGQLVSDHPRITELDINPLLVGSADVGNSVADVRIRLAP
ncbi:MAG: acetate--CoA ligase family protein [Phycisphaerae bacterium]|jgi:acetyltransferase|nr:acetate--CoA ligase family protein [Phycisphaerae bacterium]